MLTRDWLIVGGGIPALVTAFSLQQRGEQVIVIDNNQPSASRAGAGILSPLPPWRYPERLVRFAAQGAATYPALLEALGDECGYHCPGLLVLPPFDEKALARWRDRLPLLEVDAAAVCPALQPAAALLLPEVAVLNARRLIKALRRQLPRRRAVVHRLVQQHRRICHVLLDSGEKVSAANVLLSAGAWSRGLCPPPAPDIKPIRGQMLLYDSPPQKLPVAVLQEQQAFYLVQRADGRVLAGSTTEAAGFSAQPTPDGIRRLRAMAGALLPALAPRQPRTAWAGLRPAAAQPLIARHPRVDNLYLNSGHFRYGVTMAPAAAAHLLRVADGEADGSDNPYGWTTADHDGGSGRT